ncbi:hypothetical protein FA95DRAFT_207743 [Auriscalpium vulgare]|uniref:Uncharacterized protein n=1 Tax=Auriscalpium vulgare TaxID=40419 RepID=A0ACB8RM09_9AGAM|nr:hypothetical protein FA95DRAFT_207743 [Auriscalpium vulgare]
MRGGSASSKLPRRPKNQPTTIYTEEYEAQHEVKHEAPWSAPSTPKHSSHAASSSAPSRRPRSMISSSSQGVEDSTEPPIPVFRLTQSSRNHQLQAAVPWLRSCTSGRQPTKPSCRATTLSNTASAKRLTSSES